MKDPTFLGAGVVGHQANLLVRGVKAAMLPEGTVLTVPHGVAVTGMVMLLVHAASSARYF